MGDAIWSFISSVYRSKWDSLFTDHKTNTLRNKISSKFMLRIPPTNGNSKKDAPKPTPVMINKAPPPPPLPAKSQKEINAIYKYFQSKKSVNDKKNNGNNMSKSQGNKSYAQASKTPTSTSKVLKIKETFPALNAKKIDQVNSIVNRKDQKKPRIQSTTKGPSRKHIIILMSSDNTMSFMRNSSSHIANINRELRNAKTEVLVNYI